MIIMNVDNLSKIILCIYYKLTTGLVISPRTSQRSAMVIKPTKNTTKSPTNFTDMQQANMVPVKASQNHHFVENSTVLLEETFTAPIIEAIIKQSKIGSKRMYWVRVIKPTSKMKNKDISVYN